MRRYSRQHFAMVFVAAACFAVAAAAAQAEVLRFETMLEPENEVPPVESPGGGVATFTFDTATKLFSWTVSYTALTGTVTAAHIHGPAEQGKNAGVVIPFTGVATSPITGSTTLTEAQIADLLAGKWYVNLHTAANPNGEVRGMIEDED